MQIKQAAPPLEAIQQVLTECLHTSAFTFERVLSGKSTYVYRVRMADRLVYLRVLPEQHRSFGVEVYLHQLLTQRDVWVPEVIHFEHCNDILGLSLMLVTEIPGSDASGCVSAGMYTNVMEDAGRQLARIHQVGIEGFGWMMRGDASNGKAFRAEKEHLQDVIAAFLEEDVSRLAEQVFSLNEAARLRSILHAGTGLMTRHASRLVHGDFDDSHIFQQDGRFTGIIDFGEIQGSSPFYDLGHFKLHDGQRYHGFDALAEGYHDVQKLTSEDHSEIDLWALWVGIRRLGMIYDRPWGGYHEHLTHTIKQLLVRMKPNEII